MKKTPNYSQFIQTRRRFIANGVAASAGVVFASGIFKKAGSTAFAAQQTWDVVVVGSGAAGMTAALTARKRGLSVLLVEKASTFGGSTARSGAGIWIRNNSINKKAGVEDTPEEAAEYLAQVVGSEVPVNKQQAFLENGPPMIDFIMEHTPLEFRWMEGYSDYYPDLPGGKAEGASIEPKVLDGRLLGEDLKHLAPPYIPTPPGVVVYGGDYKWLTLATVSKEGVATAARSVSRFLSNKLKWKKPLTMGQALAAGLRVGLQRAQIPVWLNSPLLDISLNEAGTVDGVVVSHKNQNVLIKARHGVIIASGGF